MGSSKSATNRDTQRTCLYTVAIIAAVLRPHRGREANIKYIPDKPRWRSDWLEREMGVFFRGLPGPDTAGLLAVNERCVRLSDGLGPTSLESSRTGPLTVQHTEESKEE